MMAEGVARQLNSSANMWNYHAATDDWMRSQANENTTNRYLMSNTNLARLPRLITDFEKARKTITSKATRLARQIAVFGLLLAIISFFKITLNI